MSDVNTPQKLLKKDETLQTPHRFKLLKSYIKGPAWNETREKTIHGVNARHHINCVTVPIGNI